MKSTGDGGFVVISVSAQEFDGDVTPYLAAIREVNRDFQKSCSAVAQQVGDIVQLQLGWGVARGNGWFFRGQGDFISRNINKAFRLCDVARPKGVALDAYDFAGDGLPDLGYRRAVADLAGFGHCEVWLSSDVRAA
jgi:hypothetical protein